ncbi:MAG: protein kinase [Anaerolineae bacterium]|nr:protein kinase [Anaerolineae bacterium]
MSDLIGKTIGQYEIVEKIGVGGMATVYKAYQRSINRYVAVKILPTQFAHDPNFVKRFAQEAKAIAALEHPHILPVYDFGTQEGLTYMVMRYVEGGTLADQMGKPTSDKRIVEIVGNIARALEYAHRQGVVHRDIKPSNVLIDKQGEVLLTDFGIAKMMQDSGGTRLTGTGSILGTPEYMSPEQAEGVSVDHRSDIYSLGVVLYELLTGQPPFQAKTPLAVVLKHVKEPLSPPRTIKPDVAEPLEQVVLKAMDKNREQRYQTAAEMEQALKDALREIESAAPTTSIPPSKTQGVAPPVPTPAKGRSTMSTFLVIGLVVAVVLCLGAGGIFALAALSGRGERGTATAVSGDVSVSDGLFPKTPEPTAEPTAESSDAPTPTKSGVEVDTILPPVNLDRAELFRESFDSNENNWTIGQEIDEYGIYNAEMVDGRYRMSQKADKDVFIWEYLTGGNFDNFVVAVDAFPVEANTDAYGYGLVLRNNANTQSLYTFEIENDSFKVDLLADGNWKTLADWKSLAAINVGGPNQLMAKAAGPALTFYVNGQEATTVEDNTLLDGSIGVALNLHQAGDSATVDFDNLVVYALNDEELAGVSDIIFEEYFDSDANGWATGEFEDDYSQDEITIEDGKYTLRALTKKAAYIEKKLPNREFSDFVLTLEATPHDTAEHYSYGIAFREDSEANVYTFEIGNDGLYAVFLYDNEWIKLKDWSSAKAIKPGQTNQLKVIAQGSTLTFFVNDDQLTTLTDDTLAKGQIGLILDMFEENQSAAVDFDNLVIRRIIEP